MDFSSKINSPFSHSLKPWEPSSDSYFQLRGGSGGLSYPRDNDYEEELLRFSRMASNQLHDLVLSFNKLDMPIKAIIAINFAVWIAWRLNPNFLSKNFAEGKENVSQGRYWTMFTSSISHISIEHLIANMVCFASIAPNILAVVTPKVFYGIIGSAVVISGFVSTLLRPFSLLLWPKTQRTSRLQRLSLGFSGVNTALLYIFAVLNPTARLSILNTTPISAVTAVRRLVFTDVVGQVLEMTILPSPIGHASHLGGYLAGWLVRYVLCSKYGNKFANWNIRRKFSKDIF